MRNFTHILIVTLICACSGESRNSRLVSVVSDAVLVTPDSLVSMSPLKDTLIVDRKSAVFVGQDSATIENRKKELGEETF